jgi:hypothetical protein
MDKEEEPKSMVGQRVNELGGLRWQANEDSDVTNASSIAELNLLDQHHRSDQDT